MPRGKNSRREKKKKTKAEEPSQPRASLIKDEAETEQEEPKGTIDTKHAKPPAKPDTGAKDTKSSTAASGGSGQPPKKPTGGSGQPPKKPTASSWHKFGEEFGSRITNFLESNTPMPIQNFQTWPTLTGFPDEAKEAISSSPMLEDNYLNNRKIQALIAPKQFLKERTEAEQRLWNRVLNSTKDPNNYTAPTLKGVRQNINLSMKQKLEEGYKRLNQNFPKESVSEAMSMAQKPVSIKYFLK